MPDEKDAVLGRIAVERGYVSQEQLDEALDAQRRAREELGMDQPLVQVLLGKHLLSADQAQELRNAVAMETGEARLVAGYEVVSKLGQGGMGAVYKAKSRTTGQYVALKILPPSLATPDLVKRFEREAKVVSSLDHKHIVGCVEFGYDPRRKVHFCALELIEGEDLDRRIARLGVLPEEEAARITFQVAQALQHAFFNGLVHRDIKPANIMVTADGTAKLLDLGLARSANMEVTRLTQTGAFVGSPYYASPEQATGERDIDIRSDIYSLGCTLYHMVTGKPPFGGTTVIQVLQKHLTEKMPWPQDANPALSDGLCQIIAKMMAKSPRERYQDPKELLADLQTHLEGGEPEIGEEALKGSSVNVPVAVRRRVRERVRSPRPARESGRRAPAAAPSDTRRHRRVAADAGPEKKGAPVAMIAGIVIVAALVLGLGVVMMGGKKKPPREKPPAADGAGAGERGHAAGADGGAPAPGEEDLARGETAPGRSVSPEARSPEDIYASLPPSLMDGLVGWWKFDEGEGNVAHDSSARGNDGRIRGANWVKGRTGGALGFDGDGDNVDTGRDIMFSGPGATSFTVSVWAKSDLGGTGERFICDRMNETMDLVAIYRFSSAVLFRIRGLTGHCPTVTADDALSENTWTHIVGVRDTGDRTIKLYVDGVLSGSTADTSTGEISPRVCIGAHGGAGQWWDGLIDDFRAYDRALSPEEIKALASMGSAQPVAAAAPSSRDAPSALKSAQGYEAANANDVPGIIARYGRVARDFPGTREAAEAELQVIRLKARAEMTAAVSAGRPPNVPADAVEFGGHRYKLFTDGMTWHDAKAFCERAGGHLVTITSKEEQDFVATVARAASEGAWFGFTDEREEGKWEWVTGEAVVFTAWWPNEPSGTRPGGKEAENWGTLVTRFGHKWNDDRMRAVAFVCEWEPAPPARPPPVPADATEFGGHWYKLYRTGGLSWHDSKAFCEKQGGHLVTIASKEENELVHGLLREAPAHAWLGWTDERTEGQWEWVTGEPVTFLAWNKGEPDGSERKEEDWGIMLPGEEPQWFDYGSAERACLVCEWEPQPVARPAGVPADAARFGGHWYKLFTDGMTWHDAKAFCERQGGHLVTITSREENDFAVGLAKSGAVDCWIGFSDEGQEGRWRWVTGEAVAHERWANEQPDNWEGNQHAAMFSAIRGWRWDDSADHIGKYFICEWEPAPAARPRDVPADAARFGGHWYKVFPDRMTWSEARRFCEGQGGHLVTVTSKEENDFATNLARTVESGVWLGLTDERREGTFEWLTGEPLGFSAWAPAQPDDFRGAEDRAMLDAKLGLLWNDVTEEGSGLDAYRSAFALCEWEAGAAVAPTTGAWRPVFDGKTTDFMLPATRPNWRVEAGALTNVPGEPANLRSKESFGDGDIRVVFEITDITVVAFNFQLGPKDKRWVQFNRPECRELAGARHELVFSLRAGDASVTLDGEPVDVRLQGAPGRGAFLFHVSPENRGFIRIHSIDFREPGPEGRGAAGRVPVPGDTDVTRGLVGWWKFDEGEGTVARDSSGKGHDGELVGGPRWTTGRVGGALELDGKDDCVELQGLRFATDGDYTLSAWVKQASQSVWQTIVGKSYARLTYHHGPNAFGAWHAPGDDPEHVKYFIGERVADPGRWHHVAGVVDSRAGEVRLYVDGAMQRPGSYGAPGTAGFDYPTPWIIGMCNVAEEGHAPQYLRGLIDDVRIYDRALRPEEVAALARGHDRAEGAFVSPEAQRRVPTSLSSADSAALLAGFDALVEKGDWAGAARWAEREAASLARSEHEEGLLVSAAFVAKALAARAAAIRKGAESRAGKQTELETAKGRQKGKVGRVTDDGIVLEIKKTMRGMGTVETKMTVRWADLAPKDEKRLAKAGGWTAESADAVVAEGVLALLRKDEAAAKAALERAGDHPLAVHYRARLEGAGAPDARAPEPAAPAPTITGRWYYEEFGNPYSQEFTADGKCIFRKAGTLVWSVPYRMEQGVAIITMPDGLVLKHEFTADGRLNIEGKFLASKRSSEIGAEPSRELTLKLGNVTMALVYVQPGRFRMGFDRGEPHERPAHDVEITRGFYIGKYEVAQEQYAAVMRNETERSGKPQPNVSWNDAMEFCRRASARTGMQVRLPTEAEWECACRAGSAGLYSFGDDARILDDYAWHKGNAGGVAHTVGGRKPNAWGVHDMHGNVWEWVADWHDPGYYAKSPARDPVGPATETEGVLRGGSWFDPGAVSRSSYRFKMVRNARNSNFGFRVAVTAPARER